MMKKLIISGIFAIVLSNVFGQTEQSDLMVGGSLGFSFEKSGSTSSNKQSYTTYSLQPNFAYFVIDGLAIGLDASYTSRKSDDPDIKISSYALAPMIRYYLGSGQTKMFLHGELGIFEEKVEYDNYHSYNDQSYKGSILACGMGAATFLSENVALEAKMMYYNKKSDGQSMPKGMFFSLGFQIHLSNN